MLDAFALAMTEDVAALGAAEPLGRRRAAHRAAGGRLARVAPARRHRRTVASTQLVLFELEVEAARRPELAPLSRAWTDAYVRAVAPALAQLGCSEPGARRLDRRHRARGDELELLASGERDAEAVLLPAIERLLEALVAS